MKAVVKEFTFRDKKTNDLKIVKIAFNAEASVEAELQNFAEYDRISEKLESLGWTRFPDLKVRIYKDWN